MKTDVDVDGLKIVKRVTARGAVRNEVPQKTSCGIVPDTITTTLGIYDYEIPGGGQTLLSGIRVSGRKISCRNEYEILNPCATNIRT